MGSEKKCSIQGNERRYAKANHFSVDLLIDWDSQLLAVVLAGTSTALIHSQGKKENCPGREGRASMNPPRCVVGGSDFMPGKKIENTR